MSTRHQAKPQTPITPAVDIFAGEKLEPMTKQREVVAAEMGLRFGFVPVYRKQFYLRDTIIIVWLRTLQVEERKGFAWSVDRAEMEPDEAMKEALKWAEKKAIGIDSPMFNEAWKIFFNTINQIREAKGVAVIPDEEKKEEDDTLGGL